MKLTRKKIIELCIELWTWLAKTGKRKNEWPGWIEYEVDIEHIRNHAYCWFCFYDCHKINGGNRIRGGRCIFCPYHEIYGHCNDDETYFESWDEARTPRTRKKYAKLFLEQIKSIRSK